MKRCQVGLSLADVKKVAMLARLQLSDTELERMTDQLGQIVDYVNQLAELDTENVNPLSHAGELVNVFAEDNTRPGLSRAEVLSGAPKQDDECYRVPAVLGE